MKKNYINNPNYIDFKISQLENSRNINESRFIKLDSFPIKLNKKVENKSMKVLVIHNVIGCEINKAIIEMTQDEYNYFRQANGICVNVSPDDCIGHEATIVIDYAFTSTSVELDSHMTEIQKKYFGKWKSIENLTNINGCEKLIYCSFL